uniref:glutamine synthetase family protein n=1 Tax=uncultured Draconibacterium sp. TaxID=1573823 RepID=UPI003217FC8A
MNINQVLLNPNELVQYLQKPANEFTREDIIDFVEGNNIQMINFRYVGEDGKLKTLNFSIHNKGYLESILSTGERVDGSSLFSFVEAGSSDLYVIPRFRTAFINPFSEIPTLDILCSFYTSQGAPLENAPEYVLRKAITDFRDKTGYNLKALGELEYYVIGDIDNDYPAVDQKGYHTSEPFAKFEKLRVEAMNLIAKAGGEIKYGHSEVGCFTTEKKFYEQHEIEFLPMEIEKCADQLLIAKWILRTLGHQYGLDVSFAPKITVGKAGSGMHFHLMLEKNGENVMANENGLTTEAKKLIAGLLTYAAPLTAFGNTVPISYLRLVPHQEAPTNICWGDSNRSVLVRVPLGWVAQTSMIKDANPKQQAPIPYIPGKQTVELRSPDGSADIYELLAGITMAAQHGLENPDSLNIAKELYVNGDIFKPASKERLEKLSSLPTSCYESAECLEKNRSLFEKNGIFPPGMIDNIVYKLKQHNDKDLSERMYGKNEEIAKLVEKHLHVK